MKVSGIIMIMIMIMIYDSQMNMTTQMLIIARYVLGWRMDCEATAQASFFLNCHDN